MIKQTFWVKSLSSGIKILREKFRILMQNSLICKIPGKSLCILFTNSMIYFIILQTN